MFMFNSIKDYNVQLNEKSEFYECFYIQMSLLFMAPEIINEEDDYNEKVDVYSFCVLCFFVLNGGDISKIKIGDIFKGKMIEVPESFSPFAKRLVSDYLSIEAKDRRSFSEIVSLMEKNEYKMLPLEPLQVAEIKNKVNQHKAKIPPYK